MNIKSIVSALAALSLSSAVFAENESAQRPARGHHIPAEKLVQLVSQFDANADQSLDAAELEASIEGLFEMVKTTAKIRRETLSSKGMLDAEEQDRGLVQMFPITADVVAALIEKGDVDGSQTLDAAELLASVDVIQKLSIGFRPLGGRSLARAD